MDSFHAFAQRHRIPFSIESQPKTLVARVPAIHEAAFARLSGVHRVQRIPRTEARGRRHTSTATVAVVSDRIAPRFEVHESDLVVTKFKAPGGGGQHKNKNETAARVRHRPSGIVVQGTARRSFEQNRQDALRALQERLQRLADKQEAADENAARVAQLSTAGRPVKSFTHNYQRGEVVCHETGRSWRLRDWRKGKIAT